MRISRKQTAATQPSSLASSYNTSSSGGSSIGNMFKSSLLMTSTLPPQIQPSIAVRQIQTSGALNALALSQDGEFVVVAGREVLQVISLNEDQLHQVANLRHGSKINLNTSSNDVSWSHTSKNFIATAATNGAIVIWDIQRASVQKQDRIISEHSRAVNRIKFHPTNDCWLISASQDGTLKLWDLRTPTQTAQLSFEGKSESARDVAWCPTQPNQFAAAFENGTLQNWDIRQTRQYERKINAHNGLCLTVDWHPEGRYLASGGRDKFLKVWDVETNNRKPLISIQSIASVVRSQWRPTGLSEQQDSMMRSSEQYYIASCSLLTDYRIQLWNLDRPYVPLYSFEGHSNAVTGIQWSQQSGDTLYSVGKDSTLIVNRCLRDFTLQAQEQAYISVEATGYKPTDTMTCNIMAWAPSGSLMVATKIQPNVKQSLANPIYLQHLQHNNMTWSGSSIPQSLNSQISASNNQLERRITPKEDILEQDHTSVASRLNVTSYFSRRQPPKKVTTMPQSAIQAAIQQSKQMDATGRELSLTPFKPDLFQSLSIIEFDVEFDFQVFAYLAENYTLDQPEHNANVAEYAQQLELANMWRIVTSLLETTADCLQNIVDDTWWKNLLLWYADKDDYQTASVLAILLIKQKPALVRDSSASVNGWFWTYWEQLNSAQLFKQAAEVQKFGIYALERLKVALPAQQVQSSIFYVSCQTCRKPLMSTDRYCPSCETLINCSVCRQPVYMNKDIYAYCRGCTHGGHADCIRHWFYSQTDVSGGLQCPAGCQHACAEQPTQQG